MSRTEGEHTSADLEAELDAVLSGLWTIATFDLWGPDKTNHGGACLVKIRVEHDDAPVTIRALPIDPWEDTRIAQDRSVYREQRVTKRVGDDTYDPVVSQFTDGDGECERLRPAMDAVAVAARRFDNRYGLFHEGSNTN